MYSECYWEPGFELRLDWEELEPAPFESAVIGPALDQLCVEVGLKYCGQHSLSEFEYPENFD